MKKPEQRKNTLSPLVSEEASMKLLVEKTGVCKDEMTKITLTYGVCASRMLKLMTLRKYQFLFPGKAPGQVKTLQ